MATVYLALGSNVGDKHSFVRRAQEQLAAVLERTVSAPLYYTKPFGVTDQDEFVNTVVRGETGLAPKQLLECIKQIEKSLGRQQRLRWGPREIDIDIIFYDQLVMDEPGLCIPHAGLAERDFVLKPLCDLCDDFVDPRSGSIVKTLLESIPAVKRTIYKTTD